jgi:hypothetical protein
MRYVTFGGATVTLERVPTVMPVASKRIAGPSFPMRATAREKLTSASYTGWSAVLHADNAEASWP